MVSESSVQGLAELEQALKEFPQLLQRKIMRGALRAGQKVILDAARNNVPVHNGLLRDSLRISTRVNGNEATATLKAGNKVAFYARWVEFGTVAHYIQPKGTKALGFLGVLVNGVHHPGAVKKPFMRPALDTRSSQAVDAFAAYIRGRLEKESLKALALEPDQTGTSP